MTFEEAEKLIASKDPRLLSLVQTAMQSAIAKASSSSMKELRKTREQIQIAETLEKALAGIPVDDPTPVQCALWEAFATKPPKIRPSQVHAQVEVNTRLLEVLGDAFSAIKQNLEKVEQQIRELRDGTKI